LKEQAADVVSQVQDAASTAVSATSEKGTIILENM